MLFSDFLVNLKFCLFQRNLYYNSSIIISSVIIWCSFSIIPPTAKDNFPQFYWEKIIFWHNITLVIKRMGQNTYPMFQSSYGDLKIWCVKILENCNVCDKYILTFPAHWDVWNNCFDFWLCLKGCNNEYCTCLGPCVKICLHEKYISLCMINHQNVEFASANGCVRNSLEIGDRAMSVVWKQLQDNTDNMSHLPYQSRLWITSVIYILLLYQIRSPGINMIELFYLSPCRSVFTTMISLYISICYNKKSYRYTSASAKKNC